MKDNLYKILVLIFSIFPISKKKIFLMSYYGNQYGCSPKYISQYMVKAHPEWDVVWAFTNPDKYDIPGIRKVRYFSFRYFYELCTSKIILTNYRMTKHFHKRNEQVYVQTWHSSLRLKMIEGDAEQTLPPHYIEMAKADSKQLDYLVSGCQYSTDIFKRCFWYDGKIIPAGTPRNDIMFSTDKELKNNILNHLGIEKGTRTILYAPTFRKGDSLEYYNIDYPRLVKTLEKNWGGKWQILVRLHPHLRPYSEQLLGKETCVKDATAYDDIQELLFAADMIISDYSSLMFDFAMTKRPCLLYVPDLEEYTKKDRKLYFDVKELPFPICKDNESLVNCIKTFKQDEYENEVNAFLNKVGSFENGKASETIIETILAHIN